MSKKVTLISRILNQPLDVRLEALDKLLKSNGFECRRVAGVIGHLLYKRPGSLPLSLPEKQMVKSCYLKRAVGLLQELIEPDEDLLKIWLRRLNITLVYPTPAN
jgi:hypothetical protein